ncbi:MAG TPA: IS66 family transposase [Chromatiaceae bacterium]|nr:IS66 family transposase [Chromatiaceae bacterium]
MLNNSNVPNKYKNVILQLIVIVQELSGKKNLNSRNSSKPPSQDGDRPRKEKTGSSGRKPGGQKKRTGVQLKPVGKPDKIEQIKVDKSKLPIGDYEDAGFRKRQVFDIVTRLVVTEYQAQIIKDSKGKRFFAEFPEHVTRPAQYGSSVKACSVYMSQFQMTPYKRMENFFHDQMDLNISAGSLFKFNKEAYTALEEFETTAKERLASSSRINVDETGININAKRHWLHTVCNDKWTYFYPHLKRGCVAIDEMGILAKFKGILCHDHWKPYYRYGPLHSLCNAHHLRELQWASDEDNQAWAAEMAQFLVKLNKKVKSAGGELSNKSQLYYRKKYRRIINDGLKECPLSVPKEKSAKRGRIKKSKSRNLLERLMKYESDVLRFMTNKCVPFTNNLAENDLRMTKVQQKISGCFRSEDGAFIFCRIRAYLITCRKNNVSPKKALLFLFNGKLPSFVNCQDKSSGDFGE